MAPLAAQFFASLTRRPRPEYKNFPPICMLQLKENHLQKFVKNNPKILVPG